MGLFSFLRSTQPRRWRFSSKYCALKSYEWDKTRNLRNGLPSAYLDLYLQTETYQWVIKLVSVYAHFNATPIMNSPKGAVCRSNWANRLYRISDKTETAWALPEFHLRPWFCSTAMIWGTAHNCQDLVCSGPRMLTGPIPKCGKADIIFKHKHFGFGFPPPQIPLPPPTVSRAIYKKIRICLHLFYKVQKHQVSKQYTKYLTIWLQNFMDSRWGFWKRQQYVYPLWHSKESCGHPGQLFITCI